mmetsp:Transcript_100562/g.322796  ORF Transcript_100562/g.322796 Transcript_100562/m.322796 type:complete len:214 (-) Transcript_100562:966-1607(-)
MLSSARRPPTHKKIPDLSPLNRFEAARLMSAGAMPTKTGCLDGAIKNLSVNSKRCGHGAANNAPPLQSRTVNSSTSDNTAFGVHASILNRPHGSTDLSVPSMAMAGVGASSHPAAPRAHCQRQLPRRHPRQQRPRRLPRQRRQERHRPLRCNCDGPLRFRAVQRRMRLPATRALLAHRQNAPSRADARSLLVFPRTSPERGPSSQSHARAHWP